MSILRRRPNRGQRRQSPLRFWLAALLLAFSTTLPIRAIQAQDPAPLLSTLRSHRDFRARVQAAFALARSTEPRVRRALERALRDSNSAVRAAAATSLGRIGNRGSIRPLTRASRDSSASVRSQAERALERIRSSGSSMSTPAIAARAARPRRNSSLPPVTIIPDSRQVQWRTVRSVLVLGEMTNRSGTPMDSIAGHLRGSVSEALRRVRRVVIYPNRTSIDRQAERTIRRRRITTLQLNGTIQRLETQRNRREVSVSAEVSVLVLEDGNIRAMLRGSARGSERPTSDLNAQRQRLAQEAVHAATQTALRRLDQTIQRASGRRGR